MSQKVFMLTCGIGYDREYDEITVCADRKTANKLGRRYLEECYVEMKMLNSIEVDDTYGMPKAPGKYTRSELEIRNELKKLSTKKLREFLCPSYWIEVSQKSVVGG